MDESYLLTLSSEDFTRLKLVQALKEELRSAPFSQATVTALCKRAGIQRTSFYRYFNDINDVAHWELFRIMRLTAVEHPLRADWRASAAELLEACLEQLRKDEEFFQRIHKEMSHTDYSSVYLSVRRHYREEILRIIGAHAPDPVDEDLEFEVDFFIYGTSNAIAQWASEGMDEDPAKVARRIFACVPPHMSDVLDACAKTAFASA